MAVEKIHLQYLALGTLQMAANRGGGREGGSCPPPGPSAYIMSHTIEARARRLISMPEDIELIINFLPL